MLNFPFLKFNRNFNFFLIYVNPLFKKCTTNFIREIPWKFQEKRKFFKYLSYL